MKHRIEWNGRNNILVLDNEGRQTQCQSFGVLRGQVPERSIRQRSPESRPQKTTRGAGGRLEEQITLSPRTWEGSVMPFKDGY